ncbi:hypothetical protein GYMLUDRAFT_995149 [Collybiopsis luxurians FD-317 M1]|uniref:F-box domain-containing protein n=1 Tax=Collybiopsis luxurians FD-317 M1 TaxID=944289 RepID=A0A0D0BES7_9AGAR|nr:hypothetical protein GYMLUDRAFT_995149 [Collybiopsis luxurians FD-317 M1]
MIFNILPCVFLYDGFNEATASPVSRLPAELLQVIFTFCKPETPLIRRFDGPTSPAIVPDASEYPVLYVSKQWRAASIALLKLAPLPTMLDLDLSSHEEIRIKNHTKATALHRLEKYLTQTSPNPISFRIYDWRGLEYLALIRDRIIYPRMFTVRTTAILKLLCEHSHRWENVILHIPSPVFHHIRDDIKYLPNLNSLELSDDGDGGIWNILIGGENTFPSFMGAKQLSSLTLHASLLQEHDLTLPWSQLTSVTLTSSNPHNFRFILIHCQNLVEYKLIDENRRNRLAPDIAVPHFALRRLWVKNCDLSSFFPSLHAPNVEELYVEGTAMDRLEDAQAIAIALPSLQKLHIKFAFCGPSTGFAKLECVSAPTLILETSGDMPGRAFDILEKKDGVRHLHLCFQQTEDEVSLLRIVKERMIKSSELEYSTSRLHSFHIEACLSSEALEELQ